MQKYIFVILLAFVYCVDSFSQWEFQNSGTSLNLYSVYFLDENNGWITGAEGTILKTTNGGDIWQAIPSGTNFSLSFVKFFNQNVGIVAGSGGTIKKSSDGGNTWYNVPSGTNLRFQEGSFINEDVGWIVGDNGIVVKTTDGGENWSTLTFVTSDNLSFVQFIDENTGWVTSELNGEIWKTTDGGNTWQYKYETLVDINLWQIHFITPDTGWAVGEFGVLIKSTDGGDTWFVQDTGTNSVNLRSIYFHDTQNGWVVGKDEYILRTTNGGDIWNLDRSGPGFELLYIFFLNQNLGWIIGTSGTILYTNNGGVPVELVSFSAEQNEDEIQLSWITATELNNQGFEIERKIIDNWEKIGYVSGNGTTTEMQYYSFTDNIKLVNNVDQIYYRLKQIDFDGTYEYSSEVVVEISKVNSYLLNQNYPNPFNPSTIISFQLAESRFVTLKVYDVLGNEVATLVNEEKPAGKFEVEFNSTDLSSGIYYYKLTAGNFTDLKKMILLK
jgi:photosystem II stability/assembly factor-like uncharacterized protein